MPMQSFDETEHAAAGTHWPWDEARTAVAFNRDGLVPAIAQQYDSGEVLMLAWMDRNALDETLRTGRAVYWSRSRGELWRKGESSGHQQHLVELRLDCDGDTVLLLVDQAGPACHTGRRHCFYHRVDDDRLTVTDDPQPDHE
jgi:phosphoribosyl-AMP cyclohydrolase